jgi:CO dehydrogenase nickel-insertion accessory protein CooC1
VLAVDCDPNPNLAESFGRESASLERWSHDGLRRVPGSLALAREPALVEVECGRLWLLGGPPGEAPLNDAVARGIAGVLLAERFDWVVTDLGAGPEFARTAVGGVLNPADVCVVLTTESRAADLAAERIEAACRDRGVEAVRRSVRESPTDTVVELLHAIGDGR